MDALRVAVVVDVDDDGDGDGGSDGDGDADTDEGNAVVLVADELAVEVAAAVGEGAATDVRGVVAGDPPFGGVGVDVVEGVALPGRFTCPNFMNVWLSYTAPSAINTLRGGNVGAIDAGMAIPNDGVGADEVGVVDAFIMLLVADADPRAAVATGLNTI